MYTHPCRLVTREFWDAENFAQGENMPRDHWQPAPLRPKEEIDALKKDFDAFVAWVAKRDDVRPTTFRALYNDHRQPPDAWVNRPSLLKAAREVDDPPRPVRSRQEWLSPAEVFALVARAVAHYADHDALPKEAAVRRPLGPTAPQPEPPEGGTVPVPSLLAAARAADRHVSETGALPARLSLGGQEVGPERLPPGGARLPGGPRGRREAARSPAASRGGARPAGRPSRLRQPEVPRHLDHLPPPVRGAPRRRDGPLAGLDRQARPPGAPKQRGIVSGPGFRMRRWERIRSMAVWKAGGVGVGRGGRRSASASGRLPRGFSPAHPRLSSPPRPPVPRRLREQSLPVGRVGRVGHLLHLPGRPEEPGPRATPTTSTRPRSSTSST